MLCVMAYTVDFNTVSTVGLESSPVAAALAGLRAHEARYVKNKYGHAFTVEPAGKRQDDHRLGTPDPQRRTRHRHLLPPAKNYSIPHREHPNRLRLLPKRPVDQHDVHR